MFFIYKMYRVCATTYHIFSYLCRDLCASHEESNHIYRYILHDNAAPCRKSMEAKAALSGGEN